MLIGAPKTLIKGSNIIIFVLKIVWSMYSKKKNRVVNISKVRKVSFSI